MTDVNCLRYDRWRTSQICLGGSINTWTVWPATFQDTQELLTKITQIPWRLIEFTARIPLLFKTVRKKGLLFHHWAMIVVALFAFTSNALTKRLAAELTLSSSDPEEVVQTVAAIAPFTSRLEENPQQVRITLTGGSFVGSETPGTLPKEYTHTVGKGETLASVAESFGVHVSDILSLNGIKPEEAGIAKVGMVLRIPALAGEQDLTWLNMANEARRKAEEEAQRSRLAAAAARAPRTALTRAGGNVEVLGRQPRGSSVNGYPWGWCTYWVATKRSVPRQMGNAKSWLASARARGMATGADPEVGAIVVTTENRFYGHVAYVEAVSGGSITISEMNYRGWGVVSRRTIPAHGGVVRGYIY